jgi:hypothetical protein
MGGREFLDDWMSGGNGCGGLAEPDSEEERDDEDENNNNRRLHGELVMRVSGLIVEVPFPSIGSGEFGASVIDGGVNIIIRAEISHVAIFPAGIGIDIFTPATEFNGDRAGIGANFLGTIKTESGDAEVIGSTIIIGIPIAARAFSLIEVLTISGPITVTNFLPMFHGRRTTISCLAILPNIKCGYAVISAFFIDFLGSDKVCETTIGVDMAAFNVSVNGGGEHGEEGNQEQFEFHIVF